MPKKNQSVLSTVVFCCLGRFSAEGVLISHEKVAGTLTAGEPAVRLCCVTAKLKKCNFVHVPFQWGGTSGIFSWLPVKRGVTLTETMHMLVCLSAHDLKFSR